MLRRDACHSRKLPGLAGVDLGLTRGKWQKCHPQEDTWVQLQGTQSVTRLPRGGDRRAGLPSG